MSYAYTRYGVQVEVTRAHWNAVRKTIQIMRDMGLDEAEIRTSVTKQFSDVPDYAYDMISHLEKDLTEADEDIVEEYLLTVRKDYFTKIDLHKYALQCRHTSAEFTELDGQPVLRVVKTEKQDRFDEDTYVLLDGLNLHNGIIRVRMRSRLLPDAPDFARGFIGIVFRVNSAGNEFESYYVRPTNGRHTDPVRRSHGSQYFSYPGYTFEYFREHGIDGYEVPVDIGLDEWIDLKAVIRYETAYFYVNDMNNPVLRVSPLKHGKGTVSGIGFYVDTGTEAFFRDLEILSVDPLPRK